MANYLSPLGLRAFLDSNGDPYSGAQLFTYVAGSSTKVTTYKDEDGNSAHANPIVLNTRGEPADGSGVTYPIWQIGGAAVKYVLAPSDDTDPPASPIATWDDIGGINDTSVSVDQWVSGPTPTYVSATSLTMVGDQTSTFHVGRRIKTTNSGGTIYSTITASAFTTLTTLTVVNDSGSLDAGLSAISYGLISATNDSIPAVVISGRDWTHQGNVTMSGKAIWTAEGANVASASDCDIWAAGDGNTVHVTGTTTITDWGTAPQAGAWMRVIFDDVLTLTYNATTNDLPTGANITTAANDSCIVYARSTSSYQVFDYDRHDGYALLQTSNASDGSSLVLLDTQTTAGASSLNFTTGISSTYDEYELHFPGLTHATDGGSIYLRVSTDGGSTWVGSASSAYHYILIGRSTVPTDGTVSATGADQILLTSSVSGFGMNSSTSQGMFGVIKFFKPSSTSQLKHFIGNLTYRNNEDANDPLSVFQLTGLYNATTAINGVQLVSPSGNIAGTAYLYGIKKS